MSNLALKRFLRDSSYEEQCEPESDLYADREYEKEPPGLHSYNILTSARLGDDCDSYTESEEIGGVFISIQF